MCMCVNALQIDDNDDDDDEDDLEADNNVEDGHEWALQPCSCDVYMSATLIGKTQTFGHFVLCQDSSLRLLSETVKPV